MKKLISTLLTIAIFCQLIPTYAYQTTGFVSFNVYVDTGNDSGYKNKETGYTDGEHLYVSTAFFEKYTYYTYNKDNTTFIRNSHASNSKFGSVEIKINTNTAILHMNNTTHFDYPLNNIYEFGDEFFLPLDQVASYLKANIIYNDDAISIYNSQYCLADAEYIMYNLEQENDVLTYSLDEVIDEVFADTDWAFYLSDVLYYFSSKIFGFKITALNCFIPGGNMSNYEEIFENCLKDNEVYLNLLSEPDMHTYNDYYYNLINSALPVTETLHKQSKTIKNISSGLKAAYETINTADALAENLNYIDVKNFSDVFSGLTKTLKWLEFILSYASINIDNRDMLENFQLVEISSHKDIPAYVALEKVSFSYSESICTAAITKGAEILSEELVDVAVDSAISAVAGGPIPVKAMVTGVNELVKLIFDLDLSKHYEGLVIYGINTVYFTKTWYSAQGQSHFKNIDETESYRLASLLYLLSIKETYNIASKLAGKYKNNTMYNDEIQKIETGIMAYYLAAQSKNFDNLQDIEDRTNENHDEIIKIFDSLVSITQEEALINQNTPELFDSWEYAAAYSIHNAHLYFDEISGNPGMGYRLIDITGDDVPEIFYLFYGGSGGVHWREGLYWTGTAYKKMSFKADDGNVTTQINISEFEFFAYQNTTNDKIEFYSGVIDKSEFKHNTPPFSWGTIHFPYALDNIVFKNGFFYVKRIYKRTYDDNDRLNTWNIVYNNEKEFMSTHKLATDYKDYYSDAYNVFDFSTTGSLDNLNNYQNVITMDVAKQIVDGYINS